MKIFTILYAVIAVGMVSCAGGGNKSVSTESIGNEVATDTVVTDYVLTDSGIGGVNLAMPVAEIPDSVAGLYDRVDKYEGKSFVGYSFVLDSIETFNAEDTDFDGKINLIALRGGSPIKADTGNGPAYIGMPESDLLNPKGDTLVTKGGDGSYHIGSFKVQVQDGKVSEIYIEWSPSAK